MYLLFSLCSLVCLAAWLSGCLSVGLSQFCFRMVYIWYIYLRYLPFPCQFCKPLLPILAMTHPCISWQLIHSQHVQEYIMRWSTGCIGQVDNESVFLSFFCFWHFLSWNTLDYDSSTKSSNFVGSIWLNRWRNNLTNTPLLRSSTSGIHIHVYTHVYWLNGKLMRYSEIVVISMCVKTRLHCMSMRVMDNNFSTPGLRMYMCMDWWTDKSTSSLLYIVCIYSGSVCEFLCMCL